MLGTDRQVYYLRLSLGNQLMLLALSQIYTVLPIVALQTLSQDDKAFAGLLNYHGEPVPVYHLFALIDEPEPSYDLNTLLLLCPAAAGLVGFLTLEDMELISLPETDIQSLPVLQSRPYVIGCVEQETWSAWVVDLEALLAFHQSATEKTHV